MWSGQEPDFFVCAAILKYLTRAVIVVAMQKVIRNVQVVFLITLLVIVAVVWYAVFYFESRQNLLVTFFDVGQGDAIFIEAPGGNQILIDGGPNDKILSKLGSVLPFWDRSIDLVILTHPHADHLDGLLEVLKRYNVSQVLESGVEHSIPEYQEWRELLEEKKVPVFIALRGQQVHAGRDIILDIFSPFESYAGRPLKNIHDSTVVSRLKYGKNSMLFMGDAEKSLEYQLLWSHTDLKSDILKVGHHGSKTSTSEDFLGAVSPQITVIQAGRRNRYGHPAQEVLDRLAAASVKIFRNDLGGDLTFVSNGAGFEKK